MAKEKERSVEVNTDGKKVKIIVRKPAGAVQNRATRYAAKVWSECLADGIMTKKELKQFMIYCGRPGLWHDWQKFQADARKERRVREELARRRRAELAEAIGLGAAGLLVASMVAGLVAWVAWLKGMFD